MCFTAPSISTMYTLGSVNNILKEDGLRPWKFTTVQELQPDDERLDFCRTILERQRLDLNFVHNVCFSDEATFHIAQIN